MTELSALPRLGARLRVTEVGPQCPLTVGEVVTIKQPSMFSLLSGELLAVVVTRESGDEVRIERGPTGAIFDEAAA
jgi:hypothetical protein